MSNDDPPVQQLLQDTLASEERRLDDLEQRVGTLRDSQAVRRPEPVAGVLPGSVTEGAGGLRELSVDDSVMMGDAEVEEARRLLAESGQQLRAVEAQLAKLEAAPRDDDLRATSPLPSAESLAPPPTRYGESPAPSIDFPRGGYRTQAIRVPKHALDSVLPADRQTRVVVPHDTDRFDEPPAAQQPPAGAPDWAQLAAGQAQILSRLSALEASMAERQGEPAAEAARVVELETRLDKVEAVCREVLRATRERSQQTQALAEGLAALQRELLRRPAPAEPTRPAEPAAPPLTASGQGRRLIARIRSGEYRRPEAGPDLAAIRAQLLGMGEEHQNLVQAHADLLERLLDLVD